MSSPYPEAFQTSATEAGLLPEETQTLWRICNGLEGYSLYEDLRANSAALVTNYPNYVQFESERGTAVDGRPIGVATVWGEDNEGASAYLQGPEHALEKIGSDTVAALMQLFAHHRTILRRFGYKKLVGCDHIDPVGDRLQEWGPKLPVDLPEFAYGAWRGKWRDQVSWGYPTPTYHEISPENKLSLELLRENPDFFGSLHGATFGSYAVVSHNHQELVNNLSGLLNSSGLALNYDQPEAPGTLIYAPAVFSTINKEQFDERRVLPEEPVNDDGGTNAVDVVGQNTTVLIPEIAWVESAAGNAPSSSTYLEAINIRAEMIRTTVEYITRTLDILSPWIENNLGLLTVHRLHGAAAWYRDMIPGVVEAQVEAARDDTKAHLLLTNAERAQVVGVFGTEALVYAGNARRLAQMANNLALQEDLTYHIHREAEVIGPIRTVPVAKQVAVQALLVLAGMRHAGTVGS